MPRKAKRLTPKQVRELPPPRDCKSPQFYSVGGVPGLQLQVAPSGSRSWVLSTSVHGRVRSLGLGSFEEISLEQARADARELRRRIRNGDDPVAERHAARQAVAERLTFAQAARHTYEAKKAQWREGPRKRDWIASLENHAFPLIGQMGVDEIELAHMLRVLEPIWTTKTETAKAVRQRIEQVLTWATVRGYRAGDNPARWRGNLKEVLPDPSKVHRTRHHPALAWDEVPDFVVKLRQRAGMAAKALEFAILTAARSGEVRHARWDEIDLAAKLWTVPADRAKTGRPHRVPLSDDAIKLLRDLPANDNPLIFPAPRGGPLSDMTLSALLKRMKVDAVPHGFRSSFKDWARNRTRYADEVSELALAHVNSDATRAAYARDELLPQRQKMMAAWAKFLREGTHKADVTSIGAGVSNA